MPNRGVRSLVRVTSWARHERAALADVLDELGPDAPTLCTGWTTKDMAAHVYVRERRLDASLGVLPLGPLSAYTERVMASTLRTLGYDEIVRRFRVVPPHLRLGPLDELMNTGEYFIHTEDVRRPNGLPAREMPEEFERAIWARVSRLARLSFRRADVAVHLEPTVGSSVVAGDTSAAEAVELRGRPSELLLLSYNRTADAEVEFRGEPAAVERLRSTKFGM
jgi:uncharacterized protein (TIGR03085 family)